MYVKITSKLLRQSACVRASPTKGFLQRLSVAWSRMDTLGSLPFPSQRPLFTPSQMSGWPSAFIPPAGIPSMLHMSASFHVAEKNQLAEGRGGGGKTHGIKEQRVMSELPGLVSASPGVWTFSRAALKNWIPAPFFFFFFFPCRSLYVFKFSRVFPECGSKSSPPMLESETWMGKLCFKNMK